MHSLEVLYLYRYRFFLELLEELRLPPFKGASLRGAFGHALRRVACAIPHQQCDSCLLRGSCAYAVLFESSPPSGFPDADKFKTFPRPYLINPPLSRQQSYQAGETLMFEVVLVGRAVDYLPHVILAFEDIGQKGLRQGSGRFNIAQVESVGPGGFATSIYADGILSGAGKAITFLSETTPSLDQRGVTLHFVTPARLEVNGKLQDSAPSFAHLIRMLAQRATLLAALYGEGNTMDSGLSESMVQAAQAVRLVDSDVVWQEHERYSSRQKSRLRQGGIVGQAVYHGPVGIFLPYLKLMEHLNIGKSTTFGLGRVAVSFG